MGQHDPNPSDHLPLKPVVFHILLALADGDLHGYGVIRSVRRQSDDRLELPTGAFYRHLAWLIKHGLVAETDERPTSDDPRRGAYYGLTDVGREVLTAEAGRLAEVVSVAREKGLLPERRTA